jgi:ketosteroid isomerase-like protein
MEPADAARRWAETWRSGWQRLDAAPIIALYATDAVLSTAPFRAPYVGRHGVRDYITQAFADEADPRVDMGEPIVDGDRAAVPWWASLSEEGADTTLAGTSVLRFDPEGLVVEQWDTWNVADERRTPPDDWGPFGPS